MLKHKKQVLNIHFQTSIAVEIVGGDLIKAVDEYPKSVNTFYLPEQSTHIEFADYDLNHQQLNWVLHD